VVLFAQIVCRRIGAESAIREVGGAIIISSDTFQGVTSLSWSCPQCYPREDVFYKHERQCYGKRTKHFDISWKIVNQNDPPWPRCTDEPSTRSTSVECGTITCDVKRETKTMRRTAYGNVCCTPPASGDPCCARLNCPCVFRMF
jgi:hypothetical protein